MFLLVLTNPGSPRQRAIKQLFVCVQREIVSSKNFDPLLAAANSSVNIRRPMSLGDNSNNGNLLTTGAATGQ